MNERDVWTERERERERGTFVVDDDDFDDDEFDGWRIMKKINACFSDRIGLYGFVFVFNGISIFVGYSMPKPSLLMNISDQRYYLNYNWGDKRLQDSSQYSDRSQQAANSFLGNRKDAAKDLDA